MTTSPHHAAGDSYATDYRYETFTFRLLTEDLRFGGHALAPGDELSIEEVEGADGARLSLRGTGRPLLIVTGSMSCPMTASSMPSLVDLHARFAERIDFVLLSAREAHPGELLAQPATAAEAREQAKRLQTFYGVPFPVVLDDATGALHRLLDSKPNAAFLFDKNGALAFRSLWASDHEGLRTALAAVAQGETPATSERKALLGPMMRAVGFIDEVFDRAGPGARRDLWRSAAPMAVTALLTRAFRFVKPSRRGAVLAASLVGLLGAALAILSA